METPFPETRAPAGMASPAREGDGREEEAGLSTGNAPATHGARAKTAMALEIRRRVGQNSGEMPNHLVAGLLPGHPADRSFMTTPDGRRFSHGDVDRLSARAASALAARGVKPGDRVAVQVEKSADALFLYLGALRAGAVFLPLNTAYTASEVAYFVGDARPTVFVADPARREALAHASLPRASRMSRRSPPTAPAPSPISAATQPDAWDDVARGPDDLAAILYTSGTTGRSKGAMMTHANLRSNAETLVETWRFTPDDMLDPRASDLPYARALRGDQRRADGGRVDDPPAKVRPGARRSRSSRRRAS